MSRLWLRALPILTMAFATLACSDGGGGISCSFDNPPAIAEGPGKWTKFRADRQNTGSIALSRSGPYETVAAGNPTQPVERTADWIFPALDEDPIGAFVGSPVLNPDASVVYVGGTDGRLRGIAASSGNLIEVTFDDGTVDFFASADPFAIVSTPIVGTLNGIDAVYVPAGNGAVFGVDGNGFALDEAWPFFFDSFSTASPTVGQDGTIYTLSLNSGIAAVCPNGAVRFLVGSGPSASSPALGRAPGNEDLDFTVYYGSDDKRLRALRPDGVQLWTFTMSAPILAAPVVLLQDDGSGPSTAAIFAVDALGMVAKLDASGRAIASFRAPTDIGRVQASPALVTHSAAVPARRLYIPSIDGGVHALDADTGARLWSYAVDGGVESSPAVVIANDDDPLPPILVFGGNDGTLHFVRDAGGQPEKIGTYTPETGMPIVSSPAVGPDGTVFFAGLDGRVYAVR